MSKTLIIVTGPPGAGKSTVSRLLAPNFSLCVNLHADDFWGYIHSGFIEPWLEEAHDQNRTVIGAVLESAQAFSEGGFTVILDGILGPWFVEEFKKKFLTKFDQVHYFVLRPDYDETVARAISRGDGALVNLSPVDHMYGEFQNLEAFEKYVIDNSTMSAEETAKHLASLVELSANLL